MPRNSGINTGRWSVRFSFGSQHHGPIFTLKQIFKRFWEIGKDLFACFVDLEKAYDRVPRDKLLMVLQEYVVNGQLLRAIESFYCKLFLLVTVIVYEKAMLCRSNMPSYVILCLLCHNKPSTSCIMQT